MSRFRSLQYPVPEAQFFGVFSKVKKRGKQKATMCHNSVPGFQSLLSQRFIDKKCQCQLRLFQRGMFCKAGYSRFHLLWDSTDVAPALAAIHQRQSLGVNFYNVQTLRVLEKVPTVLAGGEIGRSERTPAAVLELPARGERSQVPCAL